MSVTTKHRYVKSNPINKDSKYLILGTIHPHNTLNFKIDFFYGNEGSFWNILSESLNIKLDTLEDINQFLKKHKIAISDMILECDRCDEHVTKDSELCNLKLNEDLLNQISESEIETIFFTSSFNKNNAAKLFFDAFKINSNLKKEYKFDIKLKGKKLKVIILLSPSGTANIGISKSKLYIQQKEKYKAFEKPVKQFRIDFYKDKFQQVLI